MNEQKVLIVDRNSCVISTLCEYLSDELYDVFTARDGVAGFKTLRREKIDLAVVDKDIRDLDAISLLTCLKVEEIQTHVLIMGGMERLELMERMLKLGAVGVLDKPISKDKFLAKVKKCMPSQDLDKKESGVVFGGALQRSRTEL
ncbi:MAG: response regulator [Gemmatimonadota bacterium]|nr:response regulator [Gemmatimonadota bacterium]